MTTQKDLIEKAKSEYGMGGGGSDYFQFDKSGEFKLRILTPCYPLASHFFGKGMKPAICYGEDKGCPFHGENAPKDDKTGEPKGPSVKFVGYVIDRADNKLKVAELPYTVIKAVTAYQNGGGDYQFSDFPMPYDIYVTYDKEAAPSDMYKIMAARSDSPLLEEETQVLKEKLEKMTPEQYVERRKDKQRGGVATPDTREVPDYPEGEIDPEGIPF